MTDAQTIFNTVYINIMKQGKASLNGEGKCMYRSPDGSKCAVGHLIEDDEYDDDMEHTNIYGLYDLYFLPKRLAGHLELLTQLQQAHDNFSSHENFLVRYQEYMKEVAYRFKLIVPDYEKIGDD